MDDDAKRKMLVIASRIAVASLVDGKLATLMTKQSILRYFYRLVGDMPGMHGYVNDDGWGHIHDIFNRIRETGVDLEVDTDKDSGGDYFKVQYGSEWLVSGKQWNVKIEFDGVRHWSLRGYVKATFRDPGDLSSAYDIVFYLG